MQCQPLGGQLTGNQINIQFPNRLRKMTWPSFYLSPRGESSSPLNECIGTD